MSLILTKKTQDNKRAYVNNTIIPNSWHDPTVQAEKSEGRGLREVDCSLPYEAAPTVHIFLHVNL